MTAAPGIVTSGTGPPNAVVQIQPGMNAQPVVLVDQSGNFLATSGSAATAGYLADASGSVAVFAAAAPVTGQVLTATSGTTATWQAGGGGSGTATTLATLTTGVYVAGGSAPTTGQVLTATSGTAATWQNASSGFANPMTTGGDIIFENGIPGPARLAGNTTGTKEFLTSAGSGGTANAPAWGTIATTDLPVIPVSGGGTGGTTSTAGFGNLSPMTTLGDMLFENATPAAARLAGNTTSAKEFLTSTGIGGTAQAPAWGTIAAGDVPALNQNTTGTASNVTGVVAVVNGGTGGTTATVAYGNLSPMTTTGDIEYESGAGTASRLAGNTTSTREFLTSQGSGGTAQAPAWSALQSGDIPANAANTSGSAATAGTAATANALNSATTTVSVSGAAAPTAGQVLTASSGTVATWSFGLTSVLTTGGDMLFENGVPAPARLAGNTSGTKKFLTSTGAGGTANAPAWGTIVTADLAAQITPAVKQVTGVTASSTANTFGSTVTMSADAGFSGFLPCQVNFASTGVGTAETVTIQSTATYLDNSTLQTPTLTTIATNTTTSAGLTTIINMITSGTGGDGKIIKSIGFQTKSTISSSAAAMTVNVVGLSLP